MDEFRSKAGRKASLVAIISNCILTLLNNTLSDIATSVISYVGFKIGQKAADEEHPIGHGRAEAISGLVIVIFLCVVAYEIITGAFYKLFHPELITTPDIYAAMMAVFGIFVNYSISSYIIKIGEEIKSPAIVADGKHQKTDIFSSLAILISVVISNMGYPALDPIVGLLIGFLIIKTAYEIVKENINNIMGKVPSKELITQIKNVANKTPHAQGAHNIKVDYLGSYATVYLHIELDGNMTLTETHKIAHNVENNILNKIPEVKYVMVHVCPIGVIYNHEQEIDN